MALPDTIVVVPPTGQSIVVTSQDPVITTNLPVTLRNTAATDYNMIDKLADVNTAGRDDQSVLIYNANTDIYEVRPLEIDGGEF